MNREIWNDRSFNHDNPKSYPCPTCKVGVLNLNGILTKITPRGDEMEYYNYPNGIEHVFSGILKCKNADCNELVTISGQCLKDIVYGKELPDGQMLEDRFSTYYPKYFYPNLKLFELPKEITSNVSQQINLSFSNYFDDLSSCANRLRNSIELILDDLKAAKWRRTKAGKIHKFKTLHQRIEHYGLKNKNIANHLLALKIIGNEGSHIGEVQPEDILDAYEILEQLIEFAYVKKAKRIADLANEIVDRNKPRMKK
ncbi:DUF4145 domain-containing protein [uncultured Aquimarina sp.]|uniref:DUF4145 domain-containing protein n=1 Tax=uncultured Aquimarina sp. TaxID=575652 RepID=UPI0026026B99|nr:DUF4145 domain-containing protein [uncultured Aquimarina sp.]